MFRQAIKTQTLKYNFFLIAGVSILFALIGIFFYNQQGKTTLVDWLNLANSVFKFSAWFMFGYGTLQAFGRKIENANIDEKIKKIDQKVIKNKINPVNAEKTSKIEKESDQVYEEQLKALDLIKGDDRTALILYFWGIVLFLVTSLGDIILPAF